MFGASALISDDELERISRCAPVPSIDRLRSYLVKWRYVDTQLQSMWEALQAGGFTSTVRCEDATAVPERPPGHLSVANGALPAAQAALDRIGAGAKAPGSGTGWRHGP